MNELKLNEKMGFCELPIRKYIFIGGAEEGEETSYGWYYLNAEGKKVGIPEFGLRGKITGLKLVKKEFKGKANYKLDIMISADRPYAIRSGVNTTFSRGFVLALHQHLKDTGEIDEPFTIGIKVGDEAKVIFSSLFNSEDNFIKIEGWDKDVKLGPLVHEIQEAYHQDLMIDNCVECQPKAAEKGVKK